MDAKYQPAADSKALSVFAQTAKSFLWKLAIVLTGVLAYYNLNSMESSKVSYDKARNAPIVIVDGPLPEKKQHQDSIELTASSVKKFFEGDVTRAAGTDHATSQPPPSTEDHQFVLDIGSYVDRAKYQSFKSGDELLENLNQEILKDEAGEERVLDQQMDIINKAYVARQAALLTLKNENCRPEVKAQESTMANHSRSRKSTQAPNRNLDCEQLGNQITVSKGDHTKLSEDAKTEFAKITQQREARVRRVYEYLRPKLLAHVEKERNENQPIRSFAYLFPANVLDERNGIHVIYSIFWLTCMTVLIFGVLFLILLVLRPLPPFAGGAEALSEQARSFLSNRSATPELAKTLIATTAALGIGTAVAVAGGMSMPSPVGITNVQQSEYVPDRAREREKPRDWLRKPGPEASPSINLTAVAPITYPTPLTVYVPSSEGSRIHDLAREMATLDNSLQALQNNLVGMNSAVTRIDSVLTTTTPRVDKLDETTGQIINNQGTLQGDLTTAKEAIGNLQGQARSVIDDFYKRADAFNATVQDLRNDQFRQSQPLGARNIFARTSQLFSVGAERYLVTDQAYQLLRSMMCNAVQGTTNTSSSASPSASPTPVDRCKLAIRCDCKSDPLLEAVLDTLKSLIGSEPMSKSEFLGKFGANDKTKLKSWKPIILKYTRVV